LALVCPLAAWLNSGSHYVTASSLLVLSILVVAHFNLYDGRGLQDPGLLAYPLVVSLATLLLGKRAAVSTFMAGSISLAVIGYRDATLGYPAYELPDFDDFLVIFILMAVSTALIWIIIERITERTASLRASEARLHRANLTLEQRVAERTAVAEERADQLRRLAEQLTQAEQKERQRIAHILQEHLQQLLVGARYKLTLLHLRGGEEEALRRVDQVLGEALETSQSLAVELSPPILQYAGLGPALGWLGEWMLEKHGLKAEVEVEPETRMPSPDIQALLFEAARELLFNVIKHAGVDQAKLELKEEAGQFLRLTVSDQGTGFDPTFPELNVRTSGGLDLFFLRERLRFLGGDLQIQSAPGAGTRISLTLPVAAKNASASIETSAT